MSAGLFDQLDAGYARLDEDLAWLEDDPSPRKPSKRARRDGRAGERDGRGAPHAGQTPTPIASAPDANGTVAPDTVETPVTDTATADTTVLDAVETPVTDTTVLDAVGTVDVPDPSDFDAGTHAGAGLDERRAWTVWVRRVLIVLTVLLVSSAIVFAVSAGLRQAHARRAWQRLDTAVAALRDADGEARGVLDGLDADDLDDASLFDELQTRLGENAILLAADTAGLDADGLDALSDRVDGACAATADLAGRVSQSRQAKALASARALCEDTLGRARERLSSVESNEATASALDRLRETVDSAGRLGEESTADEWTDMNARLSDAIRALDDAVDAKARADEEARSRAETETQDDSGEQSQGRQSWQGYQQQQSTPQQSQSPPAQTPQSSGGASSGSDGWSVPAPDTGTNNLPGSDSSL